MIKANIEVTVSEIKIDEEYFSFKYKIFLNGNFNKEDNYSSGHAWFGEYKKFKEILKEGYAIELALQQMKDLKLTPTLISKG